MAVLAGALLEVADVDLEIGLVQVEVTSVVDGFVEVGEVLDVVEVLDVEEVLDDDAMVGLLVDVSTGRQWPAIVSGEAHG